MINGAYKLAAAAVVSAVVALPVAAQTASEQLQQYRDMLAEGNPAELYEMDGEELWYTAAGPKNATLETCDLGLGPGVVEGASAQMPRYFADTDRVQDLESRLLTCLQEIQGVDTQPIIDGSFGKGARIPMEALVAYVSGMSKGMTVDVAVDHPKEKEMLAMGEKLFFMQGGPMDFSCASCHAAKDQRIRMQDLPDLTEHAGAAAGWGNWPAYRVNRGVFWTMQRRLNDCYRQQRMPYPIYASDVTIALSMYMANMANGGEVNTPSIKR